MIPGPVAYWGEEDTGLLQNFTAKAPLTEVRDYQELCFEFKCQAFFFTYVQCHPLVKESTIASYCNYSLASHRAPWVHPGKEGKRTLGHCVINFHGIAAKGGLHES